MDTPQEQAAHRLATELRILTGQLIRRLREEARTGDLTWPQITLLGRLEREGPATLTALAKAEGVRSQSLGETVATLRAAGMIEGSPHPFDGRQTVLSITDACRDIILASRAAREDWLFHGLQSHFTPGEQATISDAAHLLKRLID